MKGCSVKDYHTGLALMLLYKLHIYVAYCSYLKQHHFNKKRYIRKSSLILISNNRKL